MLKTLKYGRKVCEFQKAVALNRSFLSDAYRCEEAWQARLKSPLIQRIKPENFFLDLEHKQTTTGHVSSIDIDIFANTVVEKYQTEELLTLIHNLRLTAETSNTLESTHHAVVRYLLNHDATEELINVLHDRLNYGIFPDHVCYNLLMDACLKRKDYASAAKFAVLPMLQEDSEHPITNALCLYSCHKYLEKPSDWVKPQPPEDESKEEIRVRVNYLKPDYFDDHFDLTDPSDLVGKTLAFYGKIMNNTLGRTCQLRGLILYKKYEDVSKVVEQWVSDVKGETVYGEVFELVKKDTEDVTGENVTEEYKAAMAQLEALKATSLCKDGLTEALENEVKTAVEKQARIDMDEQMKKYTEWENVRASVLDKQMQELKRQNKVAVLKKMKESLVEQEKLLTFFEHEEEIELKLEEIEQREEAEMQRVLAMPHAARKLKKLEKEEEYVPPKISRQRS